METVSKVTRLIDTIATLTMVVLSMCIDSGDQQLAYLLHYKLTNPYLWNGHTSVALTLLMSTWFF